MSGRPFDRVLDCWSERARIIDRVHKGGTSVEIVDQGLPLVDWDRLHCLHQSAVRLNHGVMPHYLGLSTSMVLTRRVSMLVVIGERDIELWL